MHFYKLPPQMKSRFHYLTNGVIWTGAGFNLMLIAVGWLSESTILVVLGTGFITFGLGVLLSKTRFKKIAGKFIIHINGLPEKSWIFSFQALRHYILLSTMMMLGILLRKFSGFDVYYLSIIYLIMGTTLLFSSYYFYYQFYSNPNSNSANLE